MFGSSGTSGKDGTNGGIGSNGLAGTSGTSGTTPPGFTSGTSGFDGTSGTSATGVTSGTSGSSGFIVSGNTDDGIVTYVASTFTGNVESNLTFNGSTLTVTGNVISTTSITATTFRETYSDRGTGGSVTLDLSTGNNFRRQFNTNSTVSFTNAPVSNAFGFTLITVNAGAYTIVWPGNVDWAGGGAPTLTSVGTDILVFYTYDGGTTYYGFVSGKNFS